jgi:large subunit ribosomal protein L14
MSYIGTTVNIVDNSGVSRAKCIHIHRKTKLARPGDKILLAIKRARPSAKVKKGQVHKGISVCSAYRNFYTGGHSTFCDMTSATPLKKNGDILGNRFRGPFFHRVYAKRLPKASSSISYLY